MAAGDKRPDYGTPIETVEIDGGPKGHLIINAIDLPAWKKAGYKVVTEKAAPKKKAGPKAAEE